MVWMLTIKPRFCWKELETVPLPQINPTSRYCPNKSDMPWPGSWESGVTRGFWLANQRQELDLCPIRSQVCEAPVCLMSPDSWETEFLGILELGGAWLLSDQRSGVKIDIRLTSNTLVSDTLSVTRGRVTHVTWHVLSDTWGTRTFSQFMVF